jgi:hypothetical protein
MFDGFPATKEREKIKILNPHPKGPSISVAKQGE